MHDSSTCPICHGLPVDGRMTDAEFFAFLSVCRDELAEKQLRFQQRIAGPGSWWYDLRDCSSTLVSKRLRLMLRISQRWQFISWEPSGSFATQQITQGCTSRFMSQRLSLSL